MRHPVALRSLRQPGRLRPPLFHLTNAEHCCGLSRRDGRRRRGLPDVANHKPTFRHLHYRRCLPDRGVGVPECGASAVDGGNASHFSDFGIDSRWKLVCRRRAHPSPSAPSPPGPPLSPALHRGALFSGARSSSGGLTIFEGDAPRLIRASAGWPLYAGARVRGSRSDSIQPSRR